MATTQTTRAIVIDHDAINKEFGFLIRPTLKEFNDFVLLLDKMLSENINAKFFEGDIEKEILEERKDGTKIAKPKGTLTMLDEWLTVSYRFADPATKDDMMAAFRRVRKLRQSPAHAVREDQFDQQYFKNQREILGEVYDAVRALRLVLSDHPEVRLAGYKVPNWLEEERIWAQ